MTTEQEYVNKFWQVLVKEPQKANYGKYEVIKSILSRQVDVLLLSFTDDNMKLNESFKEELTKQNTTVVFIPADTREGAQLRDFGGIAAILR